MSSEKNPEVVGCDASIMRNVWEIRMREHDHRMLLEQERLEKSALPAINRDWADRMTAKMGKYKRVERKAKPAETQPDDNIWKSKQPLGPQVAPVGRGSTPLGRPGFQGRGVSPPTSKAKKGQDKSFSKLQSLMSITQTQPSSLVWGKAWKFNKSLPAVPQGSSAGSDWGQSWMFAPYQPHLKEGEHWPNEPNLVDPQSWDLWMKTNNRMVEPQELDLSPPTEEWETSWKRFEKTKKDSAEDDEKLSKRGFFTSLVETQHQNEILCSSEWSDSWMSTKPADEALLNAAVGNHQGMETETNPDWEECWRLLNHQADGSTVPYHQKAHGPKWASSWRTAAAFNNKQSSAQNQHPGHGLVDHSPHGFHKITLVSHKRDLQLWDTFEETDEWNKSWQVPKNNSKPCEEIDRVLKASPPKMDAETKKVKKIPQVSYPTEKVDPRYEQLRHDVIHHSKKELPQSKIILLKHLQNILSSSEWRDSWKLIKNKMREERRRYKLDPLKPFRESEKGEHLKPSASEWKDSRKFTSLPLNQNPEQWQQGWSTSTQIRVNWERHLREISVEEFPKNGPTSKQVWGESWKFSRYHHRSEPAQGNEQAGKPKSGPPDNLKEHEHRASSISDWQNAWMVTETPLSHDKPSFAQWREAWRWSIYHTPHWTGREPTDRWVDEATEIQPPKTIKSLKGAQSKISRSFDSQIFGQRYPEKEWRSSWSAKSLLSGHPGTSSSGQQQHPIMVECGCKWGRSFRMANPMPQLDQPWRESAQNRGHYPVLCSRRNKTQNHNKSNLNQSVASEAKVWANSSRFLQTPNGQVKSKSRSKEQSDPRVISASKIKAKKSLYSGLEKEKQSDRKWAGCHLLGKTQPRPKKGRGSNTKLKPEDSDRKRFLEEWAESWRFFVSPGGLKKQISFKPLSGWDESWKFLLPPY